MKDTNVLDSDTLSTTLLPGKEVILFMKEGEGDRRCRTRPLDVHRVENPFTMVLRSFNLKGVRRVTTPETGRGHHGRRHRHGSLACHPESVQRDTTLGPPPGPVPRGCEDGLKIRIREVERTGEYSLDHRKVIKDKGRIQLVRRQ